MLGLARTTISRYSDSSPYDPANNTPLNGHILILTFDRLTLHIYISNSLHFEPERNPVRADRLEVILITQDAFSWFAYRRNHLKCPKVPFSLVDIPSITVSSHTWTFAKIWSERFKRYHSLHSYQHPRFWMPKEITNPSNALVIRYH